MTPSTPYGPRSRRIVVVLGVIAVLVVACTPLRGGPDPTAPGGQPPVPEPSASPSPIETPRPAGADDHSHAGTDAPGAGADTPGADPPAPTPPPAPTTPPRPPGAFPDASTTGVPAGTALAPSGRLTVTQDGAVVENLLVSGTIDVQADNVTIRRVKVLGGRIAAGQSNTGTVIEDVEIDGRRADGSQAIDAFTSGVGERNFTCRRCHIHHVGHGANIGDNVTIEDSYIHDVVFANGSHNDSIVSNGGSNMVIRGNTLRIQNSPGSSAALALYGDFEPIANVLVEGNLIDGGGYCTYGGSVDGKPHPRASNVDYVNNSFGRTYNAECGYYGPVTAFDAASGGSWTGNVWQDTGAPIAPSGG